MRPRVKTFTPKGESIYAQGRKPTGIDKIVATTRKSISYQTENYAFALAGRGLLYIPAYPGCRSLRSLDPGWSPTLLRRVGLGFQPVVINVACAFGATSFLRAASSLLQADSSLLRADSSLLQADLSLLRADSSLTARGTVSLPPEGRHVYRPRDGMFTARGAVSNESAGKSDGEAGKSDGDKGKSDGEAGKSDGDKGKNVAVR